MKIVFFGSDQFVIPVLEALEKNFQVVTVVTSLNSPISNHFKGPVLTPDKLDNEFITTNYQLPTTDLAVVASYGKIIPQDILDIPRYGFLNVHPSLLPKFRGASPVPATILSGEKETGVTIIKMDAGMDHGPIVYTSKISLSGKEDTPTLINKLFRDAAEVLVKIIPDFTEGKIDLKEQNHMEATFCKMMKKEDGYFNIDNPPSPEILDRMIRAYSPWPGVWTRWNGKIIKFLPSSSHPELDSGSIKYVVQMEGKRAVSKKNFLNGYPNFHIKSS